MRCCKSNFVSFDRDNDNRLKLKKYIYFLQLIMMTSVIDNSKKMNLENIIMSIELDIFW